MSTIFRNQGFTSPDTTDHSTRQAFTLSNGNAFVVVRDTNSASANAGYGERNGTSKIYVYESVDRSTWFLRATITPPATGSGGTRRLTAATFADNSLAIWNTSTDGTVISYCKMTYSTYAVSAWEAVYTAGAGYVSARLDGTVTDTNVPVLLHYETGNNVSRARLHTRRTSDNTWFASMTNQEANFEHSNGGGVVSIASLGGTNTARALVAVIGLTSPVGSDFGVKLKTCTLNETTGALAISPWTQRDIYCVGEALGSKTTKDQGREAKLFRTGTNEYTLAVSHSEVGRHMFVTRGTLVGTVWTITVPISNTFTSTSSGGLIDHSMAITAGVDTVTFHMAAKGQGGTNHQQMIDYVARIDRTSNSTAYAPLRGYWNDNQPSNGDTWNIYGGSDRPLAGSKHDTIELVQVSSNFRFEHRYSFPGTIPPVSVAPAAGSTVTDANPTLSIKADTNRKFKQTGIKVQWQFAKDSLFTTNLQTYRQPDTKYADVNGTNVSGVTVAYDDKLPVLAYTLTQGTWYVRSALVDENDQVGPYSTASTFTVSHPPAATNLSPSGSGQFAYGSGLVPCSWKFTDPSGTDAQTAYQIIVERNDTGAVVLDSGKIKSGNEGGTVTIPAIYKDILLQWKVRVWDRDDVVGAYSNYALFELADAPSIVINSPLDGGSVTSGVPNVSFTPTVGGGRKIVAWTVLITQGQNVIWSKSRTGQTLDSGTLVQEVGDKSYLANNQSYTVTVQATDTTGLQGVSVGNVFGTSWITPAAPVGLAVDASQYNVEDQGYIQVTWLDTGRDADFSGWGVYRRDNLINPATGAIVAFGAWNLLYIEYTVTTNYLYRDYLAPAGYQVDYRVTQQVNRFGDTVESSNTNSTSVVPISDGYWLVTPSIGSLSASAFKLSIVTGDSYTDEWESETYSVIGRGRHVDKGQHLGWNGSLDAQIRDSLTQTARQKKMRIETIRDTDAQLWLRNPFGDTLPVSVGDIQVSRIAGVGSSEFCDVTIPYSEVGV